MKTVYIAAPLFNQMERERNAFINNVLIEMGFKTYLPQLDGGVSYDLISQGDQKKYIRLDLFQKDIEALKYCDIILCLLDGRVPDEGMCIELGLAYAWGKECIALKTDDRAMDKYGDNNIMLDGCISFLACDLYQLKNHLKKLLDK